MPTDACRFFYDCNVILQVKLAYHELQQVKALRSIFGDEIDLLDTILDAERARYETGWY